MVRLLGHEGTLQLAVALGSCVLELCVVMWQWCATEVTQTNSLARTAASFHDEARKFGEKPYVKFTLDRHA